MKTVNMLDAKTHLSRLIADIEQHREDEIVIARNGHPVARLQAIEHPSRETVERRIGAAAGAFTVPDDIDTPYGDLARLFAGEANDVSDRPGSS
ncbi:MAG: prevent-host-death protein [Spirochaetaceae bacterium]|nr:MAG: prevent-host-death protein [Spirochaetaceae bacterium]